MNHNSSYPYGQIARAIEHLTANFQDQPSLGELAEKVNLSEFHFQRLFTEWAGVSPKKFGQYLTLEHAKARLRTGTPLADTAYAVGLSGTGRLHDLFVRIEGVTPGQFKQAGAGLMLTYGVFDSPFGEYVLGVINEKVALLHFLTDTDQPELILEAAWPDALLRQEPDTVQHIANQIFLINGTGDITTGKSLSVLMRGSSFQLKVWEALLKIPEGQLVSYDQIAEAIGQPTASRAVGSAIGANPIGVSDSLPPGHQKNRPLRWLPLGYQSQTSHTGLGSRPDGGDTGINRIVDCWDKNYFYDSNQRTTP